MTAFRVPLPEVKNTEELLLMVLSCTCFAAQFIPQPCKGKSLMNFCWCFNFQSGSRLGFCLFFSCSANVKPAGLPLLRREARRQASVVLVSVQPSAGGAACGTTRLCPAKLQVEIHCQVLQRCLFLLLSLFWSCGPKHCVGFS